MDFNATVSRICQLKNLFALTRMDCPELTEIQITIEDVPTDIFDRLIQLFHVKTVSGIEGWRTFLISGENYFIHVEETITIKSLKN